MTDAEILAAVRSGTHALVPLSAAANAIVGRIPLDLTDIESEGEAAVYIDGLTIDDAGRLLPALMTARVAPLAPTSHAKREL